MNWIILGIMGLAVMATAWTLFDWHARQRRLRLAGRNGDLAAVINHATHREMVRLFKVLILFVGAAVALFDLRLPFGIDLVSFRTGVIVAVGVLIGATSMWDRHHMCEMEKRADRKEAEALRVQT